MNKPIRYETTDGGPLVCADCRFGRGRVPTGFVRVCRHPKAISQREPIDGWLPTCFSMRSTGGCCGRSASLFEFPACDVARALKRPKWPVRLWQAVTRRVQS